MLAAINQKLKNRQPLTMEEMGKAMKQIMSGQIPEEEIVIFLKALRDKGETVDEISAAAKVMRQHAVTCSSLQGVVDTCGTGGDQKGTFNISTAAAFVIAGAGVPVAKHGNRSISSKAGSADILEALGVQIDLPPERVQHCIEKIGIGFFFAPRYHPAMKIVAAARKQIGTRTIFNLLGPLTNPAGARRQLIGVFAQEWCEPLAQVLSRLGSEHVMIVHGEDGMDEITLTGRTFVAELKEGQVTSRWIDPQAFDIQHCAPEDLQGGDAEANAMLLRGLLNGYESPLHQAVLLNAAAALVVAERATDISEGLEIAERSVSQGKAAEKLRELVSETNS